MCMVSAVLDYGQKIWPDLNIYKQDPVLPSVLPMWPTIDPKSIDKYKDLLKTAKEFDVVNNEPDCENPKKAEWLKNFIAKLNEIGCALIQEGDTERGIELIRSAKELEEYLT